MPRVSKKELLIVGPLPPPYAGPEIGTKTFLESALLHRTYQIRNINTTVRRSNRDKGKLDLFIVWAYFKYLYRLIHTVIQSKPDYVLYCPTSATLTGWVRDGTTLCVCALFNIKLIMQFRGGHFRYFFESIGHSYQKLIRRLLQRSNLVLVQADILKRQFDGIIPQARIGTLYNSIALDFFSYFDNVKRGAQNRAVTILFVGHLSHDKGYCDLLKTIPYLVLTYGVRYHFMGTKVKVARNIFPITLFNFKARDACDIRSWK